MKKFLFVALGLLALPTTASAINLVGGANGPLTFDAVPSATDFSTNAAALAGDGATVADEAALDALVQSLTAGGLSTALPTSGTNPPSTNAAGRYNTALQALQTSTTSVAATVLLGTLTNGTTNYIDSLAVTYDFTAIADAGETITEEIAGQRVYYSTTGAANSWTALGTFSTSGPVNLNIPALGTSFGNNPIYLLWADDNAAASSTVGEGAYTIDNFAVNATLGGPLTPPDPVFGTQAPPAANTVGAGDLDIASQTGGVVLDEAGNNVLHLNNGTLNLLTEQVDLRGVDTNANTVRVSVDLRTLDSSDGSDFEVSDNIRVTAEWSADGLTFTSLDLYNQDGGTPGDPPVWPAADDQLKLLDTGAGGAFTTFSQFLPANAETVRVRVSAVNNSATENFYFDNLNVSLVPVPEPATIAMFGLGLIGLVGYSRRRRSA